MPAQVDDLSFGFDTTFFEKGINKVTKGLTGIQTTTNVVAKGVSKGLNSMVFKLGAVFSGVKAVQGALNNMPEVGQAFGIAKDIFLKNLLFPLRKQVFPLLQKMLTWVRDSRGMFVRWGQNIANVFSSVVSGIKTVIKFLQFMGEGISDFTEKIFGKRIEGINELFDLISFKVSTLVQFVSLMIENLGGLFDGFMKGLGDISSPLKSIYDGILDIVAVFTTANENGDSFKSVLETIGNLLGNIVGFVVDMTASFVNGFAPAIENIMTPLSRMADAWSAIFDHIFTSDTKLKGWKELFENVGMVVGNTLVAAFTFIADVLERIESILPDIEETAKGVGSAVVGDVKEAQSLIKEKGLFGAIAESYGALFRGELSGKKKSVNDAIIRPDGTVIETNPKDTLVALKDNDSSFGGLTMPTMSNQEINKTMTVTIAPTIYVENGTKTEGEAVSVGLMDELRLQLNREFERGGY